MLLSLVSLSTVCLVLAYIDLDASDFPPGTDLRINQDDAFLQPQLDALEQFRDGILQWLTVYKEGPEDPRHCCGIPTTQQYNNGTSLQEERDNHTDIARELKVFLSTTVTFKWTDASHQTNEDIPNKNIDAPGVNIDLMDEHHTNYQKRPPVYTTQSDGQTHDSRVVYYHSNDTCSITVTPSLTSVLIGDIINYISYWLDSSSHGPSTERYINHSNDSTSLATIEENATSHYFDQSLSFFNHWSFILDYSAIDDNNNNKTDEACQDEQFCDEHIITLNNATSFGDYSLILVIIRLLVAAIIYKYKATGKKRLRLPKGVTVTPVLYRRGKYLELGLSKYLRRCYVSKPELVEIVSTSTSSLKDVNYDRPGLELSRRFNIDCQNPGQTSSLVINRSNFLHNLPIPGSSNTPSPFLSISNLLPAIESLEGPPESLKSVCLQNLPMICDKEDVKSQESEQQTSEIKKNSLETQLIQLSHNINYFGSNTAYYEKMALMLTALMVRTYIKRQTQSDF